MLLYEMKFLVPKYSCLQNALLGGYRPQIPILSVLCPQLNLLNPPPPPGKNSWVRHCSERWILIAEMCDSLQSKYGDNTVPVCNRDDRKAIKSTKTIRTEKVGPNRNVPAFTGVMGGGTRFDSRTGHQLNLSGECRDSAESPQVNSM
jgi:hypothetical protein